MLERARFSDSLQSRLRHGRNGSVWESDTVVLRGQECSVEGEQALLFFPSNLDLKKKWRWSRLLRSQAILLAKALKCPKSFPQALQIIFASAKEGTKFERAV